MLLSVVIPVYNTKAYLPGCLDSVLAGDCSDCEILLVDDGSTDGATPQLCDTLAARHAPLVRVIHQPNQGLGGARNTGLEAARGEYLFFPDSDDKVTPEALSVLKSAIRDTHADIIAFDFCSDDGEGHLTPMQSSYCYPDGAFRLEAHPEFLLSQPSACFRIWKRKLFMDSGIRYPGRVWYEDLRTSMKLFALAESIVTLRTPLYHYLQRPGSIMRSANVERNQEIIEAFEDLRTWYQDNGLWNRYNDILCRLCIDHLYLAASVRVLQANVHHPLLQAFSQYLRKTFPDYRKNPFLSQLPPLRKLVFRLLEGRHYKALSVLFRFRNS